MCDFGKVQNRAALASPVDYILSEGRYDYNQMKGHFTQMHIKSLGAKERGL